MKQDTIEILSKVTRELYDIVPKGSRILLFGSRARGTDHLDSDWDFLVLLNREGRASIDDYNKIGFSINTVFWMMNYDVNTIIQTESEWKAKSFTPFYKNVMEDAVVI
jgi:predicted nucleotidyltransferase